MADRYLLVIDPEANLALAGGAAMAKAFSENMRLVNETHGFSNLEWFCSYMTGGQTEIEQHMPKIKSDQKKWAKEYYTALLAAAAEGPAAYRALADRVQQWREMYLTEIDTKYKAAAAANNRQINNALIGFHAARAVKITMLGTLALLSGVGGVAGAGTISAFGVNTGVAGLGFVDGLLVGLGTKAAYNASVSWASQKKDIAGIVIENGKNDAQQPFQQEAAGLALKLAFYKQLRSWAAEMKLGEETQKMIDEMARRQKNAAGKKAKQKVAQSLERRVAKKTAQHLEREGARKTASRGLKVVGGALPVVWLAQDLWGVYKEADADLDQL